MQNGYIIHQSRFGGMLHIDTVDYLTMSDDELAQLEEKQAGLDIITDPALIGIPDVDD